MAGVRQSAGNNATATSVTVTLGQSVNAGNGLVAVHRYTTNVTNMSQPTGFTVAASQAVSGGTWMHSTVSYLGSATGGETQFTAGTGGASVAQELHILEIDGSIDSLLETLGATVGGGNTSISVSAGSTLASGDKTVVGSVGTGAIPTARATIPSGFTAAISGDTDRLRSFYKDTTETTAQSFSDSWTGDSAAVAQLVSFATTPNTGSTDHTAAPSDALGLTDIAAAAKTTVWPVTRNIQIG